MFAILKPLLDRKVKDVRFQLIKSMMHIKKQLYILLYSYVVKEFAKKETEMSTRVQRFGLHLQ